MKKYRVKEPAIIEAVQFDPHITWPDCVHSWEKENRRPRDMSWGYIETVEGAAHVQDGDWIVKDGVGNFSVWASDTFKETYEEVYNALTPELIFELGVEWQIVQQQLNGRKLFSRPVRSENLKRLLDLCEQHSASTDVIMHDDWPKLIVTGFG